MIPLTHSSKTLCWGHYHIHSKSKTTSPSYQTQSFYLVSYYPGPTLSASHHRTGHWNSVTHLEWLLWLYKGLYIAHQNKIVHLIIKDISNNFPPLWECASMCQMFHINFYVPSLLKYPRYFFTSCQYTRCWSGQWRFQVSLCFKGGLHLDEAFISKVIKY